MAVLLDYALTTVADVKESLGIDAGDTSKDNLIIRKINQATLLIEGFCNLSYGHHFKETTYTNEEYDGLGTSNLVFRMRPVTSVASFGYRNSSLNQDDWDDVESDLYFLNSAAGVLDLLFAQTNTYNTYRVTYTAGFPTIPADLAEACVMLASYMVDNSSSGVAIKRKREGQREVEYFQQGGGSNTTNSLIEDLGIDSMLSRYIYYPVAVF